MFSKSHTRKNRVVLKLFFIALLSMTVQAVYAQDATDSSSAPAKPVLPASDMANTSSKDVAKATELPSTDVPHSRVVDVHGDNYVIGVDDVLAINVWKEGELSKAVPVRPDGMITLPLVGEIKASGLTPMQLQDQITAALQKLMSDPVVTVSVTAVNSLTFNIMGQVNKPGYFPLNHPLTILDAIALSGGFRDFAKQKKIYVLRTAPDGKQEKLHFNYKEVIKGKKMAQNIYLQPRDTLVIP
ncbi:MAG: polysaccharide biosynthesis/export family protein [Candidatus Korobacteraceae bacterium]